MSVKIFDHVTAVSHIDKIEPHALKLEALASDLERDGIGGDLNNGHALHLRKMAADLRSQAAQGRLAHSFHAQAEPARLPATTANILSQLGL
jgi:hypothetical protein